MLQFTLADNPVGIYCIVGVLVNISGRSATQLILLGKRVIFKNWKILIYVHWTSRYALALAG